VLTKITEQLGGATAVFASSFGVHIRDKNEGIAVDGGRLHQGVDGADLV